MRLDVEDGIPHGVYVIGILIADVDSELLIKGEYELHDRQRIGSQIIQKQRALFHCDHLYSNFELDKGVADSRDERALRPPQKFT